MLLNTFFFNLILKFYFLWTSKQKKNWKIKVCNQDGVVDRDQRKHSVM